MVAGESALAWGVLAAAVAVAVAVTRKGGGVAGMQPLL